MKKPEVRLPQSLGGDLTLRWATVADMNELAEFNIRIHSDDAEEPELFLGHWTRDLMLGKHPTTKAADFTLVVAENEGGKIVSSANLISQTWSYDGIHFKVGRPELVGTDENYRRRGLVKAQMAAIHAKSEARGELVQAITGIPWYYRQFGYEMCVDLHGDRQFFWARQGENKKPAEEKFHLRPAVEADIPLLARLYEINGRGSLLSRVRDEAQWLFECFQANRDSVYALNMYVIETTAGREAGYVSYSHYDQQFGVTEMAVLPGFSLREAALFLIRTLKNEAEQINQQQEKPVDRINFACGAGHSLNAALEPELEAPRRPYAWYLRVPDLPAFLRHIRPVLEARLAKSVMSGHAGQTKLQFFHGQLALNWEKGKLISVEPYTPTEYFDGHAIFPGLTFLQLLFGHRSLSELKYAFADVSARSGDTAVLLNILFPKQPSWIIPLG